MFTIDDFKKKISILQYIESVTGRRAKKTGENYVISCPFHQEKNPSFVIYEHAGNYHCFGCNKHGDIIAFAMFYHAVNFVEAVQMLAEFFSIDTPFSKDEMTARTLNNMQRFFSKNRHEKKFTAWLAERKITMQTAERWAIGYIPANSGWIKQNSDMLVKSGVSTPQMLYDRVSIPIFGSNKQIISFSFRSTNKAEKLKYLHLKGFKKSHYLYGEHFIDKQAFDKEIFIVEGFFDAIRLSNIVSGYALAILGTSASDGQIDKIKNYYKNYNCSIGLMLDGDSAGRQAMTTLSQMLVRVAVPHRNYFLPDGLDPDDFFANNEQNKTMLIRTEKKNINGTKDFFTISDNDKNQKELGTIIISALSGYFVSRPEQIDKTMQILERYDTNGKYKTIFTNILNNEIISSEHLPVITPLLQEYGESALHGINKQLFFAQVSQSIEHLYQLCLTDKCLR